MQTCVSMWVSGKLIPSRLILSVIRSVT